MTDRVQLVIVGFPLSLNPVHFHNQTLVIHLHAFEFLLGFLLVLAILDVIPPCQVQLLAQLQDDVVLEVLYLLILTVEFLLQDGHLFIAWLQLSTALLFEPHVLDLKGLIIMCWWIRRRGIAMGTVSMRWLLGEGIALSAHLLMETHCSANCL